jgi:hypothetical protein
MYDWDHLGEPSDRGIGQELNAPEDAADRLGIRTALVVACVGFFLAAVWAANSPSFQKCSVFENLGDRIACYEGLRAALLQPPAK